MSKTCWFDAPTGIAGDMAVAALVDLGFPVEEIAARVGALGIEGLRVSAQKTTRGGIAGTKYVVEAREEHEHRGLAEILPRVRSCGLSPAAEAIAVTAFERLAAVEARIHATTPDRVHFHEVGAADALADIVGFACAYAGLGFVAGEACAGPLPMSRGRVDAAHGAIPIPAPATLGLLEGFLVEATEIPGELVTPTGAALLSTVARPANRAAPSTLGRAGYGAGTREIPGVPNLLRVVSVERVSARDGERAVLLEANVDDMNPQLFGPLCERLLAEGALDVWMTPVQMKKGRPGIVLSALCAPAATDTLSALIFRESTTIGVRVHPVDRRVLAREIVTVDTEFGAIRVKLARSAGEIVNAAPEFDDVRLAAERSKSPIKTVLAAAARVADALVKAGPR